MTEAKSRNKKAVLAVVEPIRKAAPEPINEPVLEFLLANIVLREQNVRTEYTDMDAMGASIRAEGIIQPLTLVPILDEKGVRTGKGELIAGYRRYFAAKKTGMTTVPVRFINADEHRRHRVAMIENLQRVDMNPMDRALGIQKMIVNEELDQKSVAQSLGVSEGYVSQHLGLLKLPAKVQSAVRNNKLEMTHARALSRLKEDEAILGLLKEAQTLTAADLNSRVEHLLVKEKEKAARAAEKAAEKPTKRKPASSEGDEDALPPQKKSLAERYADAELAPLTKTDLRTELQVRANKLDNAKTEASRTEHKFVLKGLEIAAGLK
jgi:ParB family chromosome partitioning protein